MDFECTFTPKDNRLFAAALNGHHRDVYGLLYMEPAETREALANAVYPKHVVAVHIPGSREPQPLSALQVAVRFSHSNVVRILLDAGADPHMWLTDQMCLHAAAANGDVGMLRLLLEHGARGDMPSDMYNWEDGSVFQNPLMVASKYGYLECVRVLLEAGTQDVNYRLFDGTTALSLACASGYIDVVQLLLEEGGAIMDETDGKGEALLDMAARVHQKRLACTRKVRGT